MERKRTPLIERLMAKVTKTDTCWLWTGSLQRSGHGAIGAGGDNGKVLKTHRVAYEYYKGPIPTGLQVNHICDVPNCVNPDHLYAGTRADNDRDRVARPKSDRKACNQGEASGHAKLTTADVLTIRSSNARGKDLAAQYGISPAAVCDIRKFRTWRHV